MRAEAPATTRPQARPRPARPRRVIGPMRLAALVGLIGLALTAAVSLTALELEHHNEHRLLLVQTRQAGAVLASTILTIRDPLLTALEIEASNGAEAARFARYLAPYVGPNKLLAAASLWSEAGRTPREVAHLGAAPLMSLASREGRAFLASSLHSTSFVVVGIPKGAPDRRIGYAIGDAATRLVVYGERAIPANRQVPAESNPAFANLDFATYLGRVDQLDLATTDVAPSSLPLGPGAASDVIPFGDSTLTLVARARTALGGALGAELWWIFLIAGSLVTLGTAAAAAQLAERRREAVADAETIAGLFEHLDTLYGEQRSIAETLQRALLPSRDPSLSYLEVATRYVAGAAGVDIGGDWYSVVDLGGGRFGFAVGDVSGRGVSAATVMARLRFTIQAYLLEGHDPATVLAMCSRLLEFGRDEHFATVLVGVGDHSTRRLALANAGHLEPLVVSKESSRYLGTEVGPPLGVAPTSYRASSVVLAEGETLIAYTDGLVERRGEVLDEGLARLAGAAAAARPGIEDLVSDLLEGLSHEGAEDDVAILALRWR